MGRGSASATLETHNVLYEPSRSRGAQGTDDQQDYWLLPEDLERVRLVVTEELLEYLDQNNYPETVENLRQRWPAAQKRGAKEIILKTVVLGIDNDLEATVQGALQSVANQETTLWLQHNWFIGRAFGGAHPNADCGIPAQFCGLKPAPKKHLRLLGF